MSHDPISQSLEAGAIEFREVGKHRRVPLKALMAYYRQVGRLVLFAAGGSSRSVFRFQHVLYCGQP